MCGVGLTFEAGLRPAGPPSPAPSTPCAAKVSSLKNLVNRHFTNDSENFVDARFSTFF